MLLEVDAAGGHSRPHKNFKLKGVYATLAKSCNARQLELMRFEWDSKKAAANLVKHGVSFEETVTVFFDPLAATFPDTDHSVDEWREITVGYSARSRLLLVCHTQRQGNTIRLISARPATRAEQKRHES